MNAVACEVHVIATGARAVEAGGKRELFTEDTTTALVFENGGVLKLAAAVAAGQLLFLTHKESKREVVAQVTRKRDFRPTICYVEVEFSEASPGFWGVEFSETPMAPPAPASARVGVAAVPQKSAERPAPVEEAAPPIEEDFIGDEPATPTVAPSAQDVASLKSEVEALREQLKLLQTQTVARAAVLEQSQAPADVVLPGPDPAAAPAPPLPKLRLATTEAAQGPMTEVSSSHAAASHGTVAAVSHAEAANDADEPAFSEEDLLPKPALNFDSVKPARKASSKAQSNAAPMQNVAAIGQPSAMRKDLLFAAFVFVTLGAVWYENLLPWLPRPKFFGPSAAPLVAAHPVPSAAVSAPAVAGKAAQANGTPNAAASTANAVSNEAAGTSDKAKQDGTVPAEAVNTKAPATAAADGARGDKREAVSEAAADTTAPESSAEKPEIVASAKKRATTPALSKAAMVSTEGSSDDAGTVPPKLIKAVRAVASPNALQEFSSGGAENVTFAAVVDTSGHVKPVKVLSGAPALRTAAVEALKQYQYEPATRQGKPVAARVTVTVKFLFEP